MGTSNFYSKCGQYFIIDDEEFNLYDENNNIIDFDNWAYNEYITDLKNQITDALKKKFDIYEVDKLDRNNNSYSGEIFSEITNTFTDKKDNEIYVTISLIVRSGYYTGANFDYDIEIDDYYNENEKLRDKAEKWVSKAVNEIEKIYSKYTEKHCLLGRFSNGEGIYKKA